jgi:hypothetical protein
VLGEQFGFADEIAALLSANDGGGPPRLPPAAEVLAREVTLMSTYDEAPGAVLGWLDSGADEVGLVLPLGLPEEQLREMLEAAAPAAISSDRAGAESSGDSGPTNPSERSHSAPG